MQVLTLFATSEAPRYSIYQLHNLMASNSRALGPSPPSCVWDKRYTSLHPPPPRRTVHPEDEEQTYAEFVDMGLREPNEEGTGRFVPCATRKKIGILPMLLEGDDTVDDALLRSLQQLLTAHTGLPAVALPPLGLAWDGEWSIVDELQGVAFPLADLRDMWAFPEHIRRTGARRARSTRQDARDDAPAEVFSVLKVLEEYVANSHFAVVAVGALPLAEAVEHVDEHGEVEAEEASCVVGRACGARVAVVSTHNVPRRAVLCTALHEFYHTAGFDHCVLWRCLMNSQWDGENLTRIALAFAPHNLRKLLLMHEVPPEEQPVWMLARYRRLVEVVDALGPEFRADKEWFRKKIHAVRAVTGQ